MMSRLMVGVLVLLMSFASAHAGEKITYRDIELEVPGFPAVFSVTITSSLRETGANYTYQDQWWGKGEFEGVQYIFMSKSSFKYSASNGAVPGTITERAYVIEQGAGKVYEVGLHQHFTYNANGELVVDFTFEK